MAPAPGLVDIVQNGKKIPALRGKYIFTDLTTGRIWYANYKDMLAADDGKPDRLRCWPGRHV